MQDVYDEELDEFELLGEVIREGLIDAIYHGIVVSKLAYLLAKELGENEEFCYNVAVAGVLHDIGKIRLSRYLYGKEEAPLMIEELKYVKMHSAYSYEILRKGKFPWFVLEAVYHHHENYDGSGYPSNLKGEDIPLSARILRTCDVFAALVSDRPYRAAFDPETALQVMIEEVKNFDMKVFIAFQRVAHSPGFTEILKISRNKTLFNKIEDAVLETESSNGDKVKRLVPCEIYY